MLQYLKPPVSRPTVLIGLVTCMLAAHHSSRGYSGTTDLQSAGTITVVYNHETSGGTTDLDMQGGFAALIRLGNRAIVFDAGGEASIVHGNLQKLHLAGTAVEALFISHNHWDHVYGIPGVMRASSDPPPVYAAASAANAIKQQFPRASVIGVSTPTELIPGVWSTGSLDIEFMGGPLSEHAMVLDQPDGLYVIAGCSHPGIVALVTRVREIFPEKPIELVAGGFHLRSTGDAEIRKVASELEDLGVERIGPSHCSGSLAEQIFREVWEDNFVDFKLGDTVRF